MTALASALSFLRLARANVADAAAELELTDRHDAALLAEHCDRAEQDIRTLESALTTSTAPDAHLPIASPSASAGRPLRTSADPSAVVAPTRVSSPRSPAGRDDGTYPHGAS